MPQVRCQAKRILLKAECPKCGCNIMNYNMEERLEADADKAGGRVGQSGKVAWPKFQKEKESR